MKVVSAHHIAFVGIVAAACIILSACSTSSPVASSAADSPSSTSASQAQMVNPIHEYPDATSLQQASGFLFDMPGAVTSPVYSTIDDTGIAQMQFDLENADAFHVTARAKKTDSSEDITGVYWDTWTDEFPITFFNGKGEFVENVEDTTWEVRIDAGNIATMTRFDAATGVTYAIIFQGEAVSKTAVSLWSGTSARVFHHAL